MQLAFDLYSYKLNVSLYKFFCRSIWDELKKIFTLIGELEIKTVWSRLKWRQFDSSSAFSDIKFDTGLSVLELFNAYYRRQSRSASHEMSCLVTKLTIGNSATHSAVSSTRIGDCTSQPPSS
jgi:hypothetical protein